MTQDTCSRECASELFQFSTKSGARWKRPVDTENGTHNRVCWTQAFWCVARRNRRHARCALLGGNLERLLAIASDVSLAPSVVAPLARPPRPTEVFGV